MPMVPVNGVGQIGVMASEDVAPERLPLNAWSDALNMRFRNDRVERMKGWMSVFGTPSVAPYFLLPAVDPSGTQLWLYMGLTAAHCTDGVSQYDVSRSVGGAYTAVAANAFTGGSLGGVPFVNNQADVPQYWDPVGTGDTLENLGGGWASNWRCGALRAYKQYLVAVDITKGSTRYPYMVKWSHPADPGSIPGSWDETDPTKDAGEYNLMETEDYVVDCVSLRDENIIYKEKSVWGMQFIGGQFVFRFYRKFSTFGVPAPNCAAEFSYGKHVVFTGADVIVHDGQQEESILDARARDRLISELNSPYVSTCFIQISRKYKEVWLCYPKETAIMPNAALVWSWKSNTLTFADLPACRHIALGPVGEILDTDTWDGDTAGWDTDDTIWGDRSWDPTAQNMLIAGTSDTKIYLLDSGETQDGTDFRAMVERTGIGVPFEANEPPDLHSQKLVTELWPRIDGGLGEAVKVYLGFQRNRNDPVTWKAAQDFTIGTTAKINCIITGRLLAVRFEATGAFTWTLSGLEWNVKQAGRY